MPNGGTDNCGNCPHNKRNQISPNPKTAQQATRLHFCTVHDIPLSDAYWTYCDNIYTTTPDRQIPINTIGVRSEGYARVAWLGRTAPQEVSNISACVVCGTEAKVATACESSSPVSKLMQSHAVMNTIRLGYVKLRQGYLLTTCTT